jgi:hypothetical protein
MYAVFWTLAAEMELAAVWLAATDRNSVTQAAYRIEKRLRSDPLHQGESRKSSVVRLVIERPLVVEYEVIEDDKKVRILAVSLIG